MSAYFERLLVVAGSQQDCDAYRPDGALRLFQRRLAGGSCVLEGPRHGGQAWSRLLPDLCAMQQNRPPFSEKTPAQKSISLDCSVKMTEHSPVVLCLKATNQTASHLRRCDLSHFPPHFPHFSVSISPLFCLNFLPFFLRHRSPRSLRRRTSSTKSVRVFTAFLPLSLHSLAHFRHLITIRWLISGRLWRGTDFFAYGVGAEKPFAPYWDGMKKFLAGGGR